MDESKENDHDKVLQDLDSCIIETKILVEKVMKMRLQCKELHMNMLKLHHPRCIKIITISNELVAKNAKPLLKDKKTDTKQNFEKSKKTK